MTLHTVEWIKHIYADFRLNMAADKWMTYKLVGSDVISY